MNYIPQPIMIILSKELADAFTHPTFTRFVTLVLAAFLTVGSRTVSDTVGTVRNLIPGHVSSYSRVFSKRRWSTWTVARGLCRLLLKHLVPTGTVHLAGDDTVDEHRSAKVYGKDRQKDAVHSSRSFTAFTGDIIGLF
jgi:hypothetical protein